MQRILICAYHIFLLNALPGGKHRDTIHKILADGKYNIVDDHYVARKIGPRTYTFNAGHIFDLDSINIHNVDTQKLRKRLMEEGAYLPKYDTDTF